MKNTEVLDRTDKLTDEKYDWLEQQEADIIAIGEKFDVERYTDVWYTTKIAELQLLQEKMIEDLKKLKH